jgi:hypothetical protein
MVIVIRFPRSIYYKLLYHTNWLFYYSVYVISFHLSQSDHFKQLPTTVKYIQVNRQKVHKRTQDKIYNIYDTISKY